MRKQYLVNEKLWQNLISPDISDVSMEKNNQLHEHLLFMIKRNHTIHSKDKDEAKVRMGKYKGTECD